MLTVKRPPTVAVTVRISATVSRAASMVADRRTHVTSTIIHPVYSCPHKKQMVKCFPEVYLYTCAAVLESWVPCYRRQVSYLHCLILGSSTVALSQLCYGLLCECNCDVSLMWGHAMSLLRLRFGTHLNLYIVKLTDVITCLVSIALAQQAHNVMTTSLNSQWPLYQ